MCQAYLRFIGVTELGSPREEIRNRIMCPTSFAKVLEEVISLDVDDGARLYPSLLLKANWLSIFACKKVSSGGYLNGLE